MKIREPYLFLGFLALAIVFASCKKKDVVTKQAELSVSSSEELFTSEGGTSEVAVTSNSNWNVTNSAAWCTANASTTSGNGKIAFTVQSNPATSERSVIFSVTSGSISKGINIRQLGKTILDSIAPDASGMSSNAVQLAAKIRLGLNIGNTLEAIGSETAWGNPKITKAFIDFVKQSGFNAVRIPCSWDQYRVNTSGTDLKTDWLNRVKEVVQYCVDDSLYVILNIHWDGGWLDNNINSQNQASVIEKQKSFWKQIALKMRVFDEHLMFAGSNEPPVDNATQMNILLSYHQAFIDAVRSTGGKNTYRVLVVQGPSTDIDKTATLMNTLPADPIPGRMMAEVHYYSPYQFCLMEQDASWGKMFYYWGKDYHSTTDPARNSNWGEEDYVIDEFQKMKIKFADKGIPVVLGEFSAMRRNSLSGDALTLHLASRAYYAKYVTKQAKANGMLPFYWDTGGLLSRSSNTVLDQQTLDALIQGAQ
ncbi:MAG TPA: cellulase family glycosylhydrolase [Chitinophagaceae bacterium]|jgi:aryl-phospho-beta-D-glucosidase BglC (GH1 family)|nr:cellulase family glycosylhydrolase [Chitinophagaceae bacterium]